MPKLEDLTSPAQMDETPATLKPYVFHGLDLSLRAGQAVCACPFCGKEGKFSIAVDSGLWRCWSCSIGNDNGKGGGGNALTFLRLLAAESEKTTNDYQELVDLWSLRSWESLAAWGISRSVVTGEWIAPGFGADKQLKTLYVWRQLATRRVWKGTPEMGHWLHGANLFDPSKPDAYVCEGLKDGVLCWEAFQAIGEVDGELAPASGAQALTAKANVVAVQSCGAVGTPFEKVAGLLGGQVVHLMFDSDHPRQGKTSITPPAGWEATKRAAAILAKQRLRPKELHYLSWGPEGYDSELKDGFDVGDAIGHGGIEERVKGLSALAHRIVPWIGWEERVPLPSVAVDVVECRSWRDLLRQARRFMHWRQGLEDVFTAMMAVALSTDQSGDQLFLQVIGDPGGGKTEFCDAMLASAQWCEPIEHLTGFHSGWKGKDGDDEDYSLIGRLNGKTLITAEGDLLMSNPRMMEIMSQMRRIFDGVAVATFKNRKESIKRGDLRTPWIVAGTPALLDVDQARLGDRFLRVRLDRPGEDERRKILLSAGHSAIRSVRKKVTGKAGGSLSEEKRLFRSMTAGYIDHLRNNAEELIAKTEIDEERVVDRCIDLGEFAALFRARPHADVRKNDSEATKELPSRLTHQFTRLACCVAAVTQRPEICEASMATVRKLALDTASGKTQQLARLLRKNGDDGWFLRDLAVQTSQAPAAELRWLRFMKKVGAVESWNPSGAKGSEPKWRLTDATMALWDRVFRIRT